MERRFYTPVDARDATQSRCGADVPPAIGSRQDWIGRIAGGTPASRAMKLAPRRGSEKRKGDETDGLVALFGQFGIDRLAVAAPVPQQTQSADTGQQ